MVAIAAIVAIALWMRWWPGSLSEGRAFWRRDETMYFGIACRCLHGRFDVHDFINPTFYAYVVAVAGAVTGAIRRLVGADASFSLFLARETAAPHLLLWSARIVSIFSSAFSVVVVAWIGRRLFSPAVGLIAGLLLAIDGVATTSAPLCGNESLMVLLALLAFATAIDGASLRHRLAAGLLIGLATATKYSAGILVLPLAIAYGRRVGPALLAAAAGFVLGSPMALVNFAEFRDGFSTQAGFLSAGYSAEDVVRHEIGYRYYARSFAEEHAGIVLALLCAVGIVASIARFAARRERAHVLLLSASLPLFLYIGAGIFSRQRFLLPALPFILLHAAWLIDHLRLRVALLRARPNLSLAVVLLAIVAVAAPAMAHERASLQREYGDPEPQRAVLTELKPRLTADRRVAELAIPGVFRLLLARDPWADLDVPAPSDALRDLVNGCLARLDLLPTSDRLERMIAESATLDALRQRLRDAGVDTLLIVLPTRQLLTGLGIRPEPNDRRLRACPYWNELFDWLATLPNLASGRSPDLKISAAVLDLRESPR